MAKSKLLNKLMTPVIEIYSKIVTRKRNRVFLQNGGNLLHYFKEVLDQNNITFWLTSGTLLGAYRENRLLRHDLDLDVAAFADVRPQLQAALTAAGFKLTHEFGIVGEKIVEQTFSYKNVKIDVFYADKANDKILTYCFFKAPERENEAAWNTVQIKFPNTEFIKYEFLGEQYLIPEKTQEYLSANYGEDFMTPNTKWDYRKDIPSATYFSLEEKKGYEISYI
jgi:hypothetical protein